MCIPAGSGAPGAKAVKPTYKSTVKDDQQSVWRRRKRSVSCRSWVWRQKIREVGGGDEGSSTHTHWPEWVAALFALKIGAEGAKVGKVWAGISQHAVTNSPGTVLDAAVRLQHSKVYITWLIAADRWYKLSAWLTSLWCTLYCERHTDRRTKLQCYAALVLTVNWLLPSLSS